MYTFLYVLGVPGAPEVTFINDSNGVNITLVEPYSLVGATISQYGLTAQVSSQNLTVWVNFTTSTFNFVFTEYNISMCQDQNVSFSLCAYNAAGKGDFRHASVFVPGNNRHCDAATSTTRSWILLACKSN